MKIEKEEAEGREEEEVGSLQWVKRDTQKEAEMETVAESHQLMSSRRKIKKLLLLRSISNALFIRRDIIPQILAC